MTVWNQLMVDVECMGTTSEAALMSIGAAFFNLETYEVGPSFCMPIHLATSVSLGMKMEPATVLWWLRQSDAARRGITFGLNDITKVLREFKEFYVSNCRPQDTRTWANSARFDLGILETAYRLAGVDVPWRWNLETCFRTVRGLNPHIIYDPATQKQGVAHDAVDDAIFQIGHLFKIKQYNDAHPRS